MFSLHFTESDPAHAHAHQLACPTLSSISLPQLPTFLSHCLFFRSVHVIRSALALSCLYTCTLIYACITYVIRTCISFLFMTCTIHEPHRLGSALLALLCSVSQEQSRAHSTFIHTFPLLSSWTRFLLIHNPPISSQLSSSTESESCVLVHVFYLTAHEHEQNTKRKTNP